MDEFLGGVDRGPVHQFHAAGNDAGADDARDAFAGILGALETDQQGARGLGFFQDAHGDFGDDAEQAFGAGDDAHAGRSRRNRDACRRAGRSRR